MNANRANDNLAEERYPGIPEPDNMRRMNDADGSAYVDGICGDSMEMYLAIENNKVVDATFFTDGCTASRVCGSTAARLAMNKSLSKVLHLSPGDIIDAWGELPGGNVHCAILAISTLHKALADYLLQTQRG
jgi:nitrogen fixation protein NifU and related proteins